MHGGRAGIDHRLDQLERVERAAEAGLGIGDDRREPVDVILALHVLDLIGADQGVVNAPDQVGQAGHGIQALVGIRLERVVRVRCHLPAADVDRTQPRLPHLDGLVAGHRAEHAHDRLGLQQVPQSCCAHGGQGVVQLNRPAQAQHL